MHQSRSYTRACRSQQFFVNHYSEPDLPADWTTHLQVRSASPTQGGHCL